MCLFKFMQIRILMDQRATIWWWAKQLKRAVTPAEMCGHNLPSHHHGVCYASLDHNNQPRYNIPHICVDSVVPRVLNIKVMRVVQPARGEPTTAERHWWAHVIGVSDRQRWLTVRVFKCLRLVAFCVLNFSIVNSLNVMFLCVASNKLLFYIMVCMIF